MFIIERKISNPLMLFYTKIFFGDTRKCYSNVVYIPAAGMDRNGK